nr:PilZ domain-containing protein [Oceanococcus sp. HetDA_MAG_MS8]
MSQPGILTLHIKEKQALQHAYMPFVQNGGLFIPTAKNYKLGDEVFILLSLLEDKERLPVAAKVVWITPRGAQNQRQQGIGVQFSPQDSGETQKRIETALAGMKDPERPTHTM